MRLLLKKLLQSVLLGQNIFILAKAAQNSGFAQNSFALAKAAQNCVFRPKWLYFGKSYSKLCVFTTVAWLQQKLLKTVCFAKIVFFRPKHTDQISQNVKLV